MSSSVMSFRGRWIEANDSVIAVWMFFAIEELEKILPRKAWMVKLQESWNSQIEIGILMDVKFAEYAVDNESHTVLLEVSNGVLQRLSKFGENISISVLNNMNIGGIKWGRDVNRSVFERVSRGLINLLKEDDSAHPDATEVHKW